MLDIKWIVSNPKEFDDLLIKRGLSPLSETIIKLDSEKRRIVTLAQRLQTARNQKTALVGTLKDKYHPDLEDIKKDIKDIDDKMRSLHLQLNNAEELNNIVATIPNILAPEVPYGTDETMNVVLRHHGKEYEEHNNLSDQLSTPHFELGSTLGMMDFTQTSKISGSRFVTLKGDLARLERALVNFMLDIHTKQFDFLEVSPPYLVRDEAMYNSGQLPKFAGDSFATTNGYRLIPTGEVALVNMVADKIIARDELPIRYAAYTPCFRSEAGSAGKDTRGMVRLHQFSKVELVSITTPEESELEHEYLLNASEEVLKLLDLPYRISLMCSGEVGFSARKQYDIEVWLPGQKQYREIASCSNCGDFQARRMKARYKEYGKNSTKLVHTLNSSGLPIGRTIVAIMENYQQQDGSIQIPEVLVSYMGGVEIIQKI